MSENQNKRGKGGDSSKGGKKSGNAYNTSNENPLSQGSPPPGIAYFIWFWKVQRYIGEKIRNRRLRIVFYVTVPLIAMFLVFAYIFRDTGHFQYQAQSIGYSRASQPPRGDVEFNLIANLQNKSSSQRYLKNFIVVLWEDEGSGKTLFYSLPSWYGEVSLVRASTTIPVDLPLLFEANEEKILKWQYQLNSSTEGNWDLLTQEECINNTAACANICANISKRNKSLLGETIFSNRLAVRVGSQSSSTLSKSNHECTAREYKYAILMMDSRGNVFDETGKLESLDVMYAWWTFSNNKTIPERLFAMLKIFSRIFYWKLTALVPLLE